MFLHCLLSSEQILNEAALVNSLKETWLLATKLVHLGLAKCETLANIKMRLIQSIFAAAVMPFFFRVLCRHTRSKNTFAGFFFLVSRPNFLNIPIKN